MKTKTIFKTEVSKLRDLRNGLSMNQKQNGTQVILSNGNKDKMKKVADLLSEAANLLEQIN